MQKRFRNYLAVLLTILVSLFAFSPAIAFAENTDVNAALTRNSQLKQISKDKIKSEVNKAFEGDEFVEVLIEMNKQVNTKIASQKATKKLSSKATPYQTKIAKRFAVVDALKSTAKMTQKDLLDYLEKQQNIGKVKEFKSFYIVNMVYVKTTKEVVEELSYRTEIKSINLNNKIEMDWPTISKTNNIMTNNINSDDSIEWGLKNIEVPAVWDTYGIYGDGVVVGVIDTGFEWEHEALQSKWRGFNPDDPANPTTEGNWFDAVAGQELPYDVPEIPHGSHVTGTILGQDPSGENKIGVAPNAQFITAKAFTKDGGEDAWLLAAGEWMLAPNGDPSLAPDIINNSWGGGPGLDEWYRPMVQAWRNAGILPVFSSGNEPNGVPAPPGSVTAPSNYPECFAVGATNINSQRGIFSRLGPGPYEGDLKPNVAAPGVNVRSSVPGGYEGGWNGTSMASPHVSGLAALLLSANASLTPDELEQIMADTATPTTDEDYPEAPNYGYGNGIINAFNAVSSIASGLGVIKGNVLRDGSDVQEPTILNHVQLNDQYTGFNVPVEIEVEDDIAITNVELLLKSDGAPYWIMIPLNRTSGDHKKGVYGGKIPGGLVQEPGFQYKIKVSDYGNNSVETEIYDVSVKFGENPDEYSTDFSEEPSNWLIMDGDWQWGVPKTGPENEDGNKLVATKLNGNYANSGESWFVTPPLDLRNTEYAALTLKHWFEIADTYDKARVAITNDFGDNWEIVHEFTKEESAWKDLYVNLADYAKSPVPVFVAFVFQTSLFGDASGWYLDDVNLVGEDNIAPQIPENVHAEATTIGINLNWDKSDDVDIEKYEIYRSTTTAAISLELIGESQTTSYVDSNVEDGEVYKYSVKAHDYAGNVSGFSDEVIIAAPSITILYSNDFEENTEGWTSGGEENSWEWGVPTAGPDSAFSGIKVWGTNLDGQYARYGDFWLESPEFDLTEVDSADLSFKQWLSTEARWDKANLKISTDDGDTWEDVLVQDGVKDTWDTVAIPLSEYTGNMVKVRFNLKSDVSGNDYGWYVDDVSISSTTSSAITLKTSSDVSDNSFVEKEKLEYKVNKKIDYSTEKGDYKIYSDNNTNGVGGLPVDAVVTVVETGRSMHVNPLNGSYRIMHPANEAGESWTVRVEAYGYYPVEEQVQLEEDAEVIKNFVLEQIPTGTINGTIVNERTGEPVVGAYVRVINDTKIVPVMTDENGNFILSDVIKGDWTIKVTHGEYFEIEADVHVNGNETTEVSVEMKPFIGFSDEIAYDDGTDENATVLNSAGNGLAVRMTPNGTALLKGINIKIYGEEFPNPGGTEFTIAAYDSKEDGTPGEMVFQTEPLDVVRGQWNFIDLSQYGFATNKDFYVTTIQTKIGTESPAVCTDTTASAGRSYMYVEGGFQPMKAEDGNVMMRSVVEYALDCPSITVPSNMTYTNNEKITVSGTVNTDSEVNVYVNDVLVKTVETNNKQFTSEVELTEGENKIYATATVESGETDASQTIIVVKDIVNPELNIETPVDGLVVNKEVVIVKGNAVDTNLSEILVNEESVKFNEDGTFETKIIVNDGENVINIKAVDKAGNKVTKEVKVTVNINAPTITGITPDSNVIVKAGDEVKVSFHSDAEGAKAFFNIIISNVNVNIDKNGIEMVEVEPGFYKGSWVVPEGIALLNATIKVEITDVSGNHAEEIAPGTITTADNLDIPIEILGLNIKQQFGGTVVEAEIKNVNRMTQSPTLIIVVSDDQNRVVNISTANISELLPGKSIILGSGFNKPESGTYTVRALVWDTIENMESLAEPMEKPFVIE